MSEKNNLLALAQKYTLKHKLKNFSPAGIQRAISEGVSSKYQDRMDTLRDADSSMRETAILFKDYLKSAEKAFKDNRYLDVAHWCSMINDGTKLMLKDAKPVVDLQDSEIAEYYTRHEDANPEHNYFAAEDGLISTAGLLDRLFGNSIEKLYWKKVRESKLAVQSLISKTEKLVAITYSSLDRMGTARAKGNIGVWIEDLQRISKAQKEFQIFAKGVYDKHLKQLADIIKANNQQAKAVSPAQNTQVSVPSQNLPAIPNIDKAEEAEELVDNEPFELSNKKENKFEPGRPALNDPRVVEKQNQKEFEQIKGLTDLLKGNAPISPVIQDKIEEPKIEEKLVEPAIVPAEIKSVDKKIEAPVAPIVKPIEAPKQVEIPKVAPIVPKAPIVPRAPTQTTVQDPPKRGRGRPRKYPLPATNVQKTEPSATVQETVQPVQESGISEANPFSSDSAPSISAPKESPVHVDIKGKNPASPPDNGPKPIIEPNIVDDKAFGDIDKKLTLVLIPKIKPDNLDEVKEQLQQKLGHPVRFVTKENGAEITKKFKEAGYELDAMIYDDAIKEISAPKADPLTLLNDPEFLANLPRLSNGFFDKGRIIDVVKSPKDNATMNLYPEFKNMDKTTRKAVIDKLNEIDENGSSIPAKTTEVPKTAPLEKLPEPTLKENSPNAVSKEPELEHYLNKLEGPKVPEKLNYPEAKPDLTEDEIEQIVYMHGDLLEKLLKKPIKDLSEGDAFQLLNNREYVNALPRNSDKTFNIKLISQFPEVKILKTPEFDSSKMYFSTLKGFETGKTPYPKEKAASNVEDFLVKLAHKKFLIELKKVAETQNKGLMAALMCRYSEEIENVNPLMSAKLLIQAERLLD